MVDPSFVSITRYSVCLLYAKEWSWRFYHSQFLVSLPYSARYSLSYMVKICKVVPGEKMLTDAKPIVVCHPSDSKELKFEYLIEHQLRYISNDKILANDANFLRRTKHFITKRLNYFLFHIDLEKFLIQTYNEDLIIRFISFF